LLRPQADFASLLLRAGLASIFIVHGAIKVAQIAPLMNLSLAAQTALGWTELICGLVMIPGVLSRLSALVLAVLQVGAIATETYPYAMGGLVIRRQGVDWRQVGPEYNLVLILMCLSLIVLGSGSLSIDAALKRMILGKKRGKAAPPAAAAAAAAAGDGQPAAVNGGIQAAEAASPLGR